MSGDFPRIRRKNTFNLFRESRKLESFDEFPLLRPDVDPQFHVSRNSVDQPFWVIMAKDCMLTQASGRSRVMFREGPARYFDIEPGEFVYVPGGSAHRILSVEEGIQARYKACAFGSETVLWFCDECDREIYRFHWTQDEMLAQAGYQSAVRAFNGSEADRTCGSCNAVHAPIDMAPFRWGAVADALGRGDDDD